MKNIINNIFEEENFVLEKYRNKKLSNLIMHFDNKIIKQNKKLSFLICKKDLVDFYKKFNWKLIKNNNISIPDHSFSTNGMIFNYNNAQKGGMKYIFYINFFVIIY